MGYRVEAEGESAGRLRTAGLAAAVAGAGASAGLTLWVGRNNPSLLLLALFLAWVLAPFVGLLAADRLSRHWSPQTKSTLYIVMLVVAVVCVAVYGDVALRPRATPAFMFLVVPLCSWLLIATAIAIAAFSSRGSSTTR